MRSQVLLCLATLLLVSACGDTVVLCDPADPACAGPQGEMGAPGPQGDTGPAGPAGPSCPVTDVINAGSATLEVAILDEAGAAIPGNSTVIGYQGQIVASGVQFFAVAADGTCDPDLPVFNRAVMFKGADRATTPLLTKAAQGVTLQSVVITQVVLTASVAIANKWTLTNVKLLDVQQSSGAPSPEKWTMSFDQFELVHYENGTPQLPGFCWNLVTNMAC